MSSNPPSTKQPTFLQRVAAKPPAMSAACFLSTVFLGGAVQLAYGIDPASVSAFAVITTFLGMLAVGAWAITDDHAIMKHFGVRLSVAAISGIGTGYLGVLFGSIAWFFVIFILSAAAWVIYVRR